MLETTLIALNIVRTIVILERKSDNLAALILHLNYNYDIISVITPVCQWSL